MNKVVYFILGALLIQSCNKLNLDEFQIQSPDATNEVNTFGVAIDPNQDWVMTEMLSATVTKYPADFTPVSVSIYTGHPYADSTATVLATTDVLNESFMYEKPSYLTTLYAACEDAAGYMHIVPFQANSGNIDFTVSPYLVTSSASRRAHRASAIPTYADLVWEKTLNAKIFADKGWNDRFAIIPQDASDTKQVTNLDDLVKSYQYVMPEGGNGEAALNKYAAIKNYMYTVVEEGGGEVELTQIFSHTAAGNTYLGYYYFLPGENTSIQTCDKYVFSNYADKLQGVNNTTTYTCKNYRLVYFDKNGNASYTFPEGTQIGFFMHVKQDKAIQVCNNLLGTGLGVENDDCCDWYSDGLMNTDLSLLLNQGGVNPKGGRDTWSENSHVVMYQIGNEKFLGMEDWIGDFDYNDVAFWINGAVESMPTTASQAGSQVYSFAFEDTKVGDYDLNDVVLQVNRTKVNNNPCLQVRLVAVGAMHNIKAYFKDQYGNVTPLFGGKEVHEAIGVGEGNFANTKSINVEKSKCPVTNLFYKDANGNENARNWGLYQSTLARADFYIVNETTDTEIHTPASQGLLGKTPLGVCIPHNWKWPIEQIRSTIAYPRFEAFSGNMTVNTDWYTDPDANMVLGFE